MGLRINISFKSRCQMIVALEWARRFPNPVGEGMAAEIEVRRLYEMEDFASVMPAN